MCVENSDLQESVSEVLLGKDMIPNKKSPAANSDPAELCDLCIFGKVSPTTLEEEVVMEVELTAS